MEICKNCSLDQLNKKAAFGGYLNLYRYTRTDRCTGIAACHERCRIGESIVYLCWRPGNVNSLTENIVKSLNSSQRDNNLITLTAAVLPQTVFSQEEETKRKFDTGTPFWFPQRPNLKIADALLLPHELLPPLFFGREATSVSRAPTYLLYKNHPSSTRRRKETVITKDMPDEKDPVDVALVIVGENPCISVWKLESEFNNKNGLMFKTESHYVARTFLGRLLGDATEVIPSKLIASLDDPPRVLTPLAAFYS